MICLSDQIHAIQDTGRNTCFLPQGTVSVILSDPPDPPCKDSYAQITLKSFVWLSMKLISKLVDNLKKVIFKCDIYYWRKTKGIIRT